jgi:hypothetical protein
LGAVFPSERYYDAPALAAADIGVAMGVGGTDGALETADIALMADDLSKLATTIRLARRAERIIRANIALSLLTKTVFVVLAITGHTTLWMAVAADMGTSLLVVLKRAPRAASRPRGGVAQLAWSDFSLPRKDPLRGMREALDVLIHRAQRI